MSNSSCITFFEDLHFQRIFSDIDKDQKLILFNYITSSLSVFLTLKQQMITLKMAD